MSDRVERKLLALLTDPHESPYGNPIPGLAELGGSPSDGFRQGVHALTDAVGTSAPSEELTLVVRRLGEPLQSDSVLLSELVRAALRPGRRVVAVRVGNTIRVRGDGGEVDLGLTDAQHVFVDRVP